MVLAETIDLPTDKTSAGKNFHLVASDLTAWPGHKFDIDFTYNDYRNRWAWEMTHQTSGRSIGGTANLDQVNAIWPFIVQEFITTSEATEVDAITPDTLGSQVQFAVYPGPRGGNFLPEADLTEQERNELLRRTDGDDYWWYE